MSDNNLIHAEVMKTKSIKGNINEYLNSLTAKMIERARAGTYNIHMPSSEIVEGVKQELTKAGYKVTHNMNQATISWE